MVLSGDERDRYSSREESGPDRRDAQLSRHIREVNSSITRQSADGCFRNFRTNRRQYPIKASRATGNGTKVEYLARTVGLQGRVVSVVSFVDHQMQLGNLCLRKVRRHFFDASRSLVGKPRAGIGDKKQHPGCALTKRLPRCQPKRIKTALGSVSAAVGSDGTHSAAKLLIVGREWTVRELQHFSRSVKNLVAKRHKADILIETALA